MHETERAPGSFYPWILPSAERSEHGFGRTWATYLKKERRSIADRSTINTAGSRESRGSWRIGLAAASARGIVRLETFVPMVHGRLTQSTRRSKITGAVRARTRYFYLQIAVLSVSAYNKLASPARNVASRSREKVAESSETPDSASGKDLGDVAPTTECRNDCIFRDN